VLQQFPEGQPGHVSGREILMPVHLAGVYDRDEVWVRETRGDPPLALEAPPVRLVAGKLGAQDLQRDHRAIRLVDGPEDDADPALAEELLEAIRAQAAAGFELGRGGRAGHGARIESVATTR
jgi:hypothetical protein